MKIKNESVVAYLLLIQKETLKKKETMLSRKKYIFKTIITTKNKMCSIDIKTNFLLSFFIFFHIYVPTKIFFNQCFKTINRSVIGI